MDNINNALGPQLWKRQNLIVEEDSGPVSCPFYYRNPLKIRTVIALASAIQTSSHRGTKA